MSTKRSLDLETKTAKKQKVGHHWSLGLLDSIKDSSSHVQSDSKVVTIKDKYPKAEFHYLVIPKEKISSLRSITKDHLKLLKHMDTVGKEVSSKHEGKVFKFGYHAEPSMSHLHLHVISDDMNSDCLKTKKHWNSFTTNFFLESKEICRQLEVDGKITLISPETCKKLMDSALKCHKCDYIPKNLPDLKKHIVTHLK